MTPTRSLLPVLASMNERSPSLVKVQAYIVIDNPYNQVWASQGKRVGGWSILWSVAMLTMLQVRLTQARSEQWDPSH